jgi:diguanylate cyclase (GGDEF)-like protein
MINYIPIISILTMFSVIAMLVLIGFFILRNISNNTMNEFLIYENRIESLLDSKQQEIIQRKKMEKDLEKARDDLEIQVIKRTSELSKTVEALKEQVNERKRVEKKLEYLSFTDELTGLYNRRGFFNLTEHQLKIAKRQNIGMVLLYIDLDDLKGINDTFGHNKGDNALIYIASILKKTYRESDIIARLGGDEFVVILLETNENYFETIKSRLQKNITQYNEKREQDYRLSLSMGVTFYNPEKSFSIDELLAEGDKLMYEEKKKKRDINN